MNRNLELLLKIQEVDHRLDELTARSAALPRQIDELEERKAEAAIHLANTRQEHDDAVRRRRKKERDLETVEEKITKIKSQLPQVKTNREYHAFLAEITSLEGEKGRLEEDILLAMEESSAGEGRIRGVEEQVRTEQARIDGEINEVRRNVAEVEQEIQTEQRLMKELVGQTDDDDYRVYRKVRDHRGGLVVCAIKDAICQGCHMEVPRQIYVEVKKGGEIFQCPACQRLLYWPGEDAPK
jgi:predicted  nucleic acid-binding Zn-ribbon protein